MSCSDCISTQSSLDFLERLRQPSGDNLLPLAGSFEITLKCNVRCRHCYILYPGATSEEMSTDEVKRVLDILAENGVMLLLITGGEPLSRPDFKEIWTYAKQKGFILSLYTNATLINEDIADFLAQWPPRRVEITIYGHTEATYEKVTGVKGSFIRFRQGVVHLRDRGLRVALKTMVLKSNVHEFFEMKKWAEDQGSNFRFDSMINPRINGDRDVLKERLDPEALGRFEATLEGGPDAFASYARIIQETAVSDKLFTCGAGIKTFHIDPRGHLHPCMLWRKSPYDMRRTPLTEGWREHVSRLRELKGPESGCNSCSNRSLCGRCPAASFLEMNDPRKSVPYHCKVGESRRKHLLSNVPAIEIAAPSGAEKPSDKMLGKPALAGYNSQLEKGRFGGSSEERVYQAHN